MEYYSRWILLVLTGLLCLLAQGHGSTLPEEEHSEKVTIDQLLLEANRHSPESSNPYYFIEHTNLLKRELDIVYRMEDWLELKHASRQKRTAAVRERSSMREKRWTNNNVNYEIERNSFSKTDLKTIYRAIRDISHYTCVSFEETSNARNRVQIGRGSGGCYSHVGMVGRTQELGLGYGCVYKSIVIHELLHAIGIHHEQTRPDRDNHVTIRFDRITDSMEYNFEKYDWNYINNFSLAYDYRSVMHYGPTAFAERYRDTTIVTKDQSMQDIIGQSPGLSLGDIRTLNSMHNCVPDTCTLTERDCQKVGGFVGKDCKCWCAGPDPARRPVEYCSQKDVDEQGSLTNSCKDFYSSCASWENDGDCDNNTYWKTMFTYCAKSCNSC